MGKYLKLFETHAEYTSYISGSDKVLPNVSYCEDNNEVHYNPIEPPTPSTITIWANEECTIKPSGNLETVYARIDGEITYPFIEEIRQGYNSISVTYDGVDNFYLMIWYNDWMLERQQPFTIGDVIQLTNPIGEEDVTGLKTEFVQS